MWLVITRSVGENKLNVTIGENAVVGAMPSGDEKGVATIGPGIRIGAGAKIGPNAMVNKDVKGGEEQW